MFTEMAYTIILPVVAVTYPNEATSASNHMAGENIIDRLETKPEGQPCLSCETSQNYLNPVDIGGLGTLWWVYPHIAIPRKSAKMIMLNTERHGCRPSEILRKILGQLYIRKASALLRDLDLLSFSEALKLGPILFWSGALPSSLAFARGAWC